MIYILFGALGALFCLAVATAGFFIGWFIRGKIEALRQVEPVDPPGEEENKRLVAEQEALHQMMSYTIDDVYGINRKESDDA